MRILHVFDHSLPLHSGYSFRSAAILKQQRRLGWETHHLTSPKHRAEESEETVDGLTFHRSPDPPAVFLKLPLIREWAQIRSLRRRLYTLAREIDPDLLHVHSPVLNALAAAPVARALGRPWVYEIRAFWEDAAAAHGTCREGDLRYRTTRAAETRAMRTADGVAVICEGLRRDVIARGARPERCVVIPNAVDSDRFAPLERKDPELARKLGIGEKSVLGFIGSFYSYEGIDDALEAMRLLRESGRDLHLLLVGGGPEESALKARAAALGIEDCVTFTGRVDHGEIAAYYSLLDILVLPRKPLRLTELVTPLKPLEAMAQHKLVLASDVGGHCELIDDGRTGMLYPAGSPERLAQAIERVLSGSVDVAAIIATARRHVETERTWVRSVANYEALFERLAGAHR